MNVKKMIDGSAEFSKDGLRISLSPTCLTISRPAAAINGVTIGYYAYSSHINLSPDEARWLVKELQDSLDWIDSLGLSIKGDPSAVIMNEREKKRESLRQWLKS